MKFRGCSLCLFLSTVMAYQCASAQILGPQMPTTVSGRQTLFGICYYGLPGTLAANESQCRSQRLNDMRSLCMQVASEANDFEALRYYGQQTGDCIVFLTPELLRPAARAFVALQMAALDLIEDPERATAAQLRAVSAAFEALAARLRSLLPGGRCGDADDESCDTDGAGDQGSGADSARPPAGLIE